LNIPKELSVVINRRTDNTLAKIKDEKTTKFHNTEEKNQQTRNPQ